MSAGESKSAGGSADKILRGHDASVNSVSFSPDGSKIVSGSADNTVRVWDSNTGSELMRQRVGLLGTRVMSVSFSPDGSKIVFGSADNKVRVWDSNTRDEHILFSRRMHIGRVTSVDWHGNKIVSGSWDKTVRVWDSQTEALIHELTGHTEWVNSVAFSPDGSRIVSGSLDNTVRVWDSQTGAELMRLRVGLLGSDVNSVSFSPDGSKIVSGSDDETVRVWDSNTGDELMRLVGHTDLVMSVSFSPDGSKIVSGSDDNTVRVWDAVSGECVLGPLEGHTDLVNSVAWSPDRSRIVSGSLDGTVRVWDVPPSVYRPRPPSYPPPSQLLRDINRRSAQMLGSVARRLEVLPDGAVATIRKKRMLVKKKEVEYERIDHPMVVAPEGTQCAICLEELSDTSSGYTVKLTCGHYFHAKCIKGWQKSGQRSSSTCPLCRNKVIANEYTDGILRLRF